MSDVGVEVDREMVRRVAELARVGIGEGEEERLVGEMRRLVAYVGRVAEWEEGTGVGETKDWAAGAGSGPRLADASLPAGFQENAPELTGDLLKVPAVMSGDGEDEDPLVEAPAGGTRATEEEQRRTALPMDAEAGVTGWSARRIAEAVRSGEVVAGEVVEAFLERISEVEPAVGAWLEVFEEEARRGAEAVDRKVAAGENPGPLAGVPVAVKDNLSLAGHAMTCASRILEGYTAPYTATAVARLAAAGAIPLGRANMDELGMGAGTESSAFQPTRNPWHPERVPGGSSGGPAAALAAGMAPMALGSDTGGSVRQPAAFCGVVGVKPTWGRVSRHGLAAFASSLDTVGPMARDVLDAARCLTLIAGADRWDATCPSREVPDHEAEAVRRADAAGGLRLGVVAELERMEMAPAARRRWGETVDTLAGLGYDVVEVPVPTLEVAAEVYHLVAACEASSNLARLDGIRYGRRAGAGDDAGSLDALYRRSRGEGFGPEVRRRVLLGTFALSAGYRDAYYLRARRLMDRLRGEMTAALDTVDLLVGPTTPGGAFRLGAYRDDPLAVYEADVFTVPASLAGLPAVAVPSGLDDDGLPLSLHVTGRHFGEPAMLGLALAFDRARENSSGELS